jgi:hypothetical protein
VLCLTAGAIALLSLPGEACRVPVPSGQRESPRAGDSVLVIAADPGDEPLRRGGLIAQSLRAAASVAIVWLASGDGSSIDVMLEERPLKPSGPAFRKMRPTRTERVYLYHLSARRGYQPAALPSNQRGATPPRGGLFGHAAIVPRSRIRTKHASRSR